MEFFNISFSFVLIPLSLAIIFSLIRAGHLPALNITNPTVALDTLRDHISFQLETLFKQLYGEDYVLPDGLSIEAVGERIYSEVTNLAGLQDILVDLLSQGVLSPHFVNAQDFVLNYI